MAELSVNIEVAEMDDVPVLASIQVAAFTTDPAVQIMLPDPANHKAVVIDMLTRQIPNPSWLVMKAVTQDSEVVIGWASWLRHGYEQTGDSLSMKRSRADTHNQTADSDNPSSKGQPTDLGAFMADKQARYLDSLMSDKKCLKFNSLFTHPYHQRQGVGTALLRWGTNLAATERVPCYLAGTPSAYDVYSANGFHTPMSLDIDLQDWGPGGAEGTKRWGNYRMSIMEKPAPNDNATGF